MATVEVIKTVEEHIQPLANNEPSKEVVVMEEKPVVVPATVQQKADEVCKTLVVAHSLALANVENEKRISFIKAWEDSEKEKLKNRAQKKFSNVDSWEIRKKAEIDNKIRKLEEELEKKKADYAEKMKNKAALIHKQAEEKRATIVAVRDEEIIRAEEFAAKYRTLGGIPKKSVGCLGG